MPDSSHSLFDFGPLAATYERWYESPEGQEYDKVQKAAVGQFLPPARPGDRLLDVGCGTGHWSGCFAAKGYEVFGLDLSPEMIDQARSYRTPMCHYEIGDACRLPTGNPAYRVVACMTTLEFVFDPDAFMAGAVRCLISGGCVVIGTLNRLAPFNQERVARGKQPYASAHLFSVSELRALLQRYGRVRLAAAGQNDDGWPSRLVRALWEQLRLGCGRSSAPFLVAMVQP